MNRDKIIKQVDKLVAKGNLEKAAPLLQSLVDADRRDWNAINRLGDIYARLGDNARANEMYTRIAAHFSEDGFNLKAIAMFKKVLKLDPNHLDAYRQLAELYQAQGLINESRTNYQVLADHYVREGDTARAREVFGRIAELEPDNVKVRTKLAQLLVKDGKTAEALEEYVAVGAELMQQGMIEEGIKVLESALELDTTNVPVMRKLAEAYSELDQHDKAISFIKGLVGRNPDNVSLQNVLGECYVKAGRIEEAEKIFEAVVEKDPTAVGGMRSMSHLLLQRGEIDSAVSHFDRLVPTLLAGGKVDQVEEFYNEVLKARPDHIPALEGLVGLGSEGGADEKVLSGRLHRLAEAYVQEDRHEEAAGVLRRLTEMEPENAQHQEKLAFVLSKLGGGEEAGAVVLEMEEGGEDASSAGGGEGVAFDLEEPEETAEVPAAAAIPSAVGGEEAFVHEHLAEAEVFIKYGLMDKAVEQLQAILEHYPANMEVHQKLKDLYLEEGLKDKAVDEMVTVAEIFRAGGDEDQAQGVLSEALTIDPNHPGLQAALGGSAGGAPPAEAEEVAGEAAGGPSADALEEVDFYISQDFKEEALDLLQELRGKFGDHPEIQERIQALGGGAVAAGAATESDEEVFAEEREFFDLASDLSQELGEDISIIDDNISAKSIDELVGDIKKKVDEQVEEEDWETHYNLGIAYKGMNLVDEAIAEFQHAAKDPSRFLECCSLLGRCFIEKGMPQLAVQWYTRGLSAEGYGEEEMQNLRYELAVLLEETGDKEKAYEYYRELQEMNGSYRDVGEKVKSLGSQLGK